MIVLEILQDYSEKKRANMHKGSSWLFSTINYEWFSTWLNVIYFTIAVLDFLNCSVFARKRIRILISFNVTKHSNGPYYKYRSNSKALKTFSCSISSFLVYYVCFRVVWKCMLYKILWGITDCTKADSKNVSHMVRI